MRHRSLMWILWPSFLIGAATSATVFALVDPLDITFLGHLQASRQQVYAGGFFLFWLMAALSSALTLHMAPRGRIVDEFGDPVEG
ncbi:membrane protein [Pusillimonas sp. T7-7]|uniref:membrane protein n=1 Tax=Pusillimonas sp. (strain T7-7) TaxID=1007105 RepID=UPI0003134196|nr:membrane protein [Pusillimonas sp. T7-7]